jgi:hypothetical protein
MPRWLEEVRITGAGVLPRDTETELMQASRIDHPASRQRAIDRAYDRSEARYPHLFQH